MQITVNGEMLEIDDGSTVADLVQRCQVEPKYVAIEINRALVPRKTFANTPLNTGDQVEIVTFVGGG
ncbi:MAG: sulfur carrier protein ThiS [Phycisphaerales bacterium]|nr:sulfur carrier protein ThiS [Phycisphaerales bacterium]